MKPNLIPHLLFLLALLPSALTAGTTETTTTAAQQLEAAAPVAPVPSAPAWHPGDPIQFLDGQVVVDVNERIRAEVRNNTFDFNDTVHANTDDTFLLQRFRVGVLVKPNALPWIKFYGSAQDTREIFSDRSDTPYVAGSEGDNTFNLREAWMDIGNLNEFPVSAKIGRQVLSYGDERLIGAFDWNNFGRTFDAAKLTLQATQKISIDAFAASVVNMEGYEPNDGDHNWEFNESNGNKDLFGGVYATDKGTLASWQTTEVYALYRDKSTNDPNYREASQRRNIPTAAVPNGFAYDLDQENYTVGFRMKSTSPGRLKGFDYELDFAYQFGTGSLPATQFRTPAQVPAVGPLPALPATFGRGLQRSLALEAYAAHAAVGYNLELAPWTPRFGLDYAVSTGDSNPRDGKSESFMNLFPTNHKFYGAMDAFSWKNIHDPSFNVTAKPNSKITLKLEHHAFFLYTNEDAWYRANAVTAVRPVGTVARNTSTFVGQETDLTASYAHTKWLNFLVGYSHFWAGDYARQTSVTPGQNRAQDDAEFFYFQSVIKL